LQKASPSILHALLRFADICDNVLVVIMQSLEG